MRPRNISKAYSRLGVDSEADLWQQQADLYAQEMERKRTAERERNMSQKGRSDSGSDDK